MKSYLIENAHGLSATVTDYGARLMSLRYRSHDLVLGYDTPEEYEGDANFFGALIGRNANRIGNARFALDGDSYDLDANDGPNNSHSGPHGYEKRLWTAESISASRVTFGLISPHMDQGYPGEFHVHATYSLLDSDTLMLTLHGTTDSATIANMTTHTYWNLNGEGSGSIYGHQLQIFSDSYFPTDGTFIPMDRVSIFDTPMDFREPRKISDNLVLAATHSDEQILRARGYNHAFSFSNSPAHSYRLIRMAELTGEQSGIHMTLRSDAPTLLMYSGGFIDHVRGKHGHVYNDGAGLALEPGFVPNAINKPFGNNSILRPNEDYLLTVSYQFSARSAQNAH